MFTTTLRKHRAIAGGGGSEDEEFGDFRDTGRADGFDAFGAGGTDREKPKGVGGGVGGSANPLPHAIEDFVFVAGRDVDPEDRFLDALAVVEEDGHQMLAAGVVGDVVAN